MARRCDYVAGIKAPSAGSLALGPRYIEIRPPKEVNTSPPDGGAQTNDRSMGVAPAVGHTTSIKNVDNLILNYTV